MHVSLCHVLLNNHLFGVSQHFHLVLRRPFLQHTYKDTHTHSKTRTYLSPIAFVYVRVSVDLCRCFCMIYSIRVPDFTDEIYYIRTHIYTYIYTQEC